MITTFTFRTNPSTYFDVENGLLKSQLLVK